MGVKSLTEFYRHCKVHFEEANRPLLRFAKHRQIYSCEFNLEFLKKEERSVSYILIPQKNLTEKKKERNRI